MAGVRAHLNMAQPLSPEERQARDLAWCRKRRSRRSGGHGRGGRETRIKNRLRLNEERLAKCIAGERYGDVVRPCRTCGQMTYWHVSAEGLPTLRDEKDNH